MKELGDITHFNNPVQVMVAIICAFTMPTGSLLIRAHHVKHIGLVVGSQILHIGSFVARAQHVRIIRADPPPQYPRPRK